MSSAWESTGQCRPVAEGATTPESLRQRDQVDNGTLEREGSPSADGESHIVVKLSGTNDSGGNDIRSLYVHVTPFTHYPCIRG